MATLDSSIVNIALPTLTKELGADLYRLKWIVIVYLFVISCLLLPFGRLSDEYGRKRVFQLGYLVFILGSALCGLSDSLSMLVVFRALQAVGASMLMVNGPAIITAAFAPTERGGALGALAMVVSMGLISGPSLGGYLISHFGWRSIFWVNIPIGLFGAYLVYQNVRMDTNSREKSSFDWAGALLQTVLLICVVLIFDPPTISLSGSAPVFFSRWLILSIAAILGVVFIHVETEASAPLFDLSLLKIQTFWTANLASFLTFVSFSAVTVLMPFFLEEIMGLPPHQAGLFMTAIPVTIFIVAPISGRLSDRFGGQELSFLGSFMGAIALLVMAGLVGTGLIAGVSSWSVILGLCMMGLSMGLFQSPNNNAIMSSVPQEKLGVASALLATVRNLGLVSGTGLATGLFSWRMEVSQNFISSVHWVYFVAGLVQLAAMVASLGKKRGPLSAETELAAEQGK